MTIFLFFMLGASFGSFIGLLVDRFPEKSIIYPQSHCDSCGQCLQVRDLIPIFSQLINRSACRFCSAPIPKSYAIIEITLGLTFILYGLDYLNLAQLLALMLSLTLSLYDIKDQSFPVIIWILATALILTLSGIKTLAHILFLLGFIAELFDIGIGSGDFFYLSSLALIVNWQSLLWVIQLASLLGILACLLHKNKRIPFVPYLSLAYLIVQAVQIMTDLQIFP